HRTPRPAAWFQKSSWLPCPPLDSNHQRTAMADVSEYLRTHAPRHRAELDDFLRIPSVSAKSEHRDDMRQAAEWLVDRMLEAGLQTAELLPTGGHPVVLGEWRGAEGAPTYLVYGHYDVQPPEPLDEWLSP